MDDTSARQAPPRDKTRRDWVLAALAALAEGGVDAVRVERIAKALGVSKGSFYWHFKDRADLLSALLDLWDDDFTQGLIRHAEPLETARARLRSVAREALALTMHGVDSARAEAAVQAWAARDPQAAARLREVDAMRIGYIRSEMVDAGMDDTQAEKRAKALYMALLGLYSARSYNAALADDDAYLDLVDLILDQPGLA